MANGLNLVILLGNLGAQPELKYLPNNTPVLNISLFSDETYFNKEGVKVEKGEWHSLAIFGNKAETITKYCNKGDQLVIIGHNETREWEKNGIKHYTTDIKVDDFRFTRGSKNAQPAQP